MPTLDFKGKQHIYAHHLTVPYRPLVPDAARSLNAGGAGPGVADDNLIIHGDNLHALKALLPRYAGRVKCIYIDPPYNTGNEGWVYNDKVNSPLMREWLKQNGPVDGEDLERHDKWLCMMWPRLHLLKELLSDDGVIFVSIDDNEQHHLRMLMDEVFGQVNFVTNIIWQKKFSPQSDARYFSDNHDFMLCYAKSKVQGRGDIGWHRKLMPRTEGHEKNYRHDDNNGRGLYSTADLSVKSYAAEYDYPITNPNTGEQHYPPRGRCWMTSQANMQIWLAEDRIYFGRDGRGKPSLKKYLQDVQDGIVPLTIWPYSEVGHTASARRAVKEIFHDRDDPFDNPKALGLLDRTLRIATNPDDIILDSFAGSGTTAHAVLALNKEDGGNRKFILVECENYADSITAERVRRVSNGVSNARDAALRAGLGGSFTYCTLGAPIDVETMLTGEHLPEYAALAAYLLHTATGISAGAGELAPQNDDGLFYGDDRADYYLLYRPDLQWLRSNAAIFNAHQAQRIYAAGRPAIVFAADKYIGQRFLTDRRITFCQIPYEMHRPATV